MQRGRGDVGQTFPQERHPFNGQFDWFALIEIAGLAGIEDRFETTQIKAFETGLLLDSIVASSTAQSRSLWRLRELMADANKLEGVFCSSDTSVPKSDVSEFIANTEAAILEINPDMIINKYGHMGDGNIHFNVFAPAGISKQKFLANIPNIQEVVRMVINKITHEMGGSISAEHGIGRLKLKDLQNYCDPTKLAVMKSIKFALDPNGIMNPGALMI